MNTLYYITSEMMTMYEAEGDPPADPNTDPAADVPKKDPNAAAADAPVDPPQDAPADPNAAPADPNAAPVDPQKDAPADPNAAPADPNAASADPFANSDSGDKLEPVKKYLMYNKLVELRHYVSVYSVGIDVDEKASKQLLQFISITIDFYDLFDYATIKSLTKDIIEKTKTVMKKRQGGKLKE